MNAEGNILSFPEYSKGTKKTVE